MGKIVVNWTAKVQKAVLKVTNPRRSAIEQTLKYVERNGTK